MYNKNNFIIPINNDILLKLRNNQGNITHIIRDPICTISQDKNRLIIKQQSESKKILLDFLTVQETTISHTLLRTTLQQLLSNIQSSNTVVFNTIEFNAIDTTTGNDTNITIPVNTSQVLQVFVNGVLIEQYNYTITLPNILTWLNNANYQLEIDDIITINYI